MRPGGGSKGKKGLLLLLPSGREAAPPRLSAAASVDGRAGSGWEGSFSGSCSSSQLAVAAGVYGSTWGSSGLPHPTVAGMDYGHTR